MYGEGVRTPANKTLYPFQVDTVFALLNNPTKHIVVAGVGTGKTAISMVWAQARCTGRGLNKVLVITTASKSKTKDIEGRNDFEAEADDFCGRGFRQNLDAFEVVSWNSLHKWVTENKHTVREWVVVADEIQRAKGWTTRMGKSFIKISSLEERKNIGIYHIWFKAMDAKNTPVHRRRRTGVVTSVVKALPRRNSR